MPRCSAPTAHSMLDMRNDTLNRVVEKAAVSGASDKGERRGRGRKEGGRERIEEGREGERGKS